MKSLVVYFSHSGRTKKVAEKIAAITESDLRELISERDYSKDEDILLKETREEIEKNFYPKLISGNDSIDSYEVVFIGSPHWHSTFAPPVLSFLKSLDFANKRIIPFCTHEGDGLGKIVENIKSECPKSNVLDGIAIEGDIEEVELKNYINQIIG